MIMTQLPMIMTQLPMIMTQLFVPGVVVSAADTTHLVPRGSPRGICEAGAR